MTITDDPKLALGNYRIITIGTHHSFCLVRQDLHARKELFLLICAQFSPNFIELFDFFVLSGAYDNRGQILRCLLQLLLSLA